MSLYPKLKVDFDNMSSPYRNRLPSTTKFTFSAPIGTSPTRASERASPIRPIRDETPLSERLAARKNFVRQSPIKTRGMTRNSNAKLQACDISSTPIRSGIKKQRLQGLHVKSPPRLFPLSSPQKSALKKPSQALLDEDYELDKENISKKRKVVLFQDDKEIKVHQASGEKPDIHSVVASLQDIVKRIQVDYTKKMAEMHSEYSVRISELEARLDKQDRIINRISRR